MLSIFCLMFMIGCKNLGNCFSMNLCSMSVSNQSNNYDRQAINFSNNYKSSKTNQTMSENEKNIYVIDEYEGEDIETNIDDDNYYFIVSNKKVSDEDAYQMVENMEITRSKMMEHFNRTMDEMRRFQEMFNF